jgi:hypothetical protein
VEPKKETAYLSLGLYYLRIDRLDDNSEQLRVLEFEVLVFNFALGYRDKK